MKMAENEAAWTWRETKIIENGAAAAWRERDENGIKSTIHFSLLHFYHVRLSFLTFIIAPNQKPFLELARLVPRRFGTKIRENIRVL
jgi:hypothetical protein